MSHRSGSSGGRAMVACLLACVSMGVACSASESDGEGNGATTEVQSALSWRTAWSWGSVDDLLDMGPSSNRTCVLSGVAGNLSAGDDCCASAAAIARKSDNLLTVGGAGHSVGGLVNAPVEGHAVCVASATNLVTVILNPKDSSVTLGPVTAARQCFLSGVWGTAGAWASSNAYARVTNDGTNWFLQSNLNTVFTGDNWGAMATCFDVPAGTWVGTGVWNAPDPGTVTANIGWDSSPVTLMACGLTGIQGHFTANDYSDGALINPPSAFPGWWTMTLKNGKKAWVTCLQ